MSYFSVCLWNFLHSNYQDLPHTLTQTLSPRASKKSITAEAWSSSPCSRWSPLLGRNQVELCPQCRRFLLLKSFYTRQLSSMERGIFFLRDLQVEAYGRCYLSNSPTQLHHRSLVGLPFHSSDQSPCASSLPPFRWVHWVHWGQSKRLRPTLKMRPDKIFK